MNFIKKTAWVVLGALVVAGYSVIAVDVYNYVFPHDPISAICLGAIMISALAQTLSWFADRWITR